MLFEVSFHLLGMEVENNIKLYYNGNTYMLFNKEQLLTIETTYIFVYQYLKENNLIIKEHVK